MVRVMAEVGATVAEDNLDQADGTRTPTNSGTPVTRDPLQDQPHSTQLLDRSRPPVMLTMTFSVTVAVSLDT